MRQPKPWMIWTGGILLSLILMMVVLDRWYWWRHASEPYRYGVTFSVKYAQELGLDPTATYTAILDDLQVKHVRLMSYWDLIEAQPGRYDFGWLDAEVQQAAARGVTVNLALGLRQPRYPECHLPGWAAALPKSERNQHLYAFIRTVVERYRGNRAVVAWELENEPLLGSFGTCDDYDRGRLATELRLVQSEDPSRPIVSNMSDEWGYPAFVPLGSEVGLSMYYRCYVSFLHIYLYNPWPAWWHTVRAAIIELIWHKPVIIHELQLEPWGPGPTEYLTMAEQDKSMSLDLMWRNYNYARATGIKDQQLWGVEWWYWRKLHGDARFWDAARQMIAGSPAWR